MNPEQEARLREALHWAVTIYNSHGIQFGEGSGGDFRFADVEALLAEVDRLRADKARLDFLDEANRRLNAKYGTTYRWKLIMNHNVNRLMIGHMDVDLNDAEPNALKSCRDAIDEKMGEVHAARAVLSTEPKGESNG